MGQQLMWDTNTYGSTQTLQSEANVNINVNPNYSIFNFMVNIQPTSGLRPNS